MPLYFLGRDVESFPSTDLANDNGLLAVGGDLSPERLIAAYSRGIFPWYNDGLPILWHCPNPRCVLEPKAFHLPRSLKKTIQRGLFEVRLDSAFEQVIDACADTRRPGQSGTWITNDMKAAYVELHRLGFAHSAESWVHGKLVGGLYGISLGLAFFGESMFAHAPDASKVAFATLVKQLVDWNFVLIDCQQQTHHLERFGAAPWPRERFLAALSNALQFPTRRGSWTLERRPD